MPCKSKSIVFKAFAPTGRFVCALVCPGCYPGLGASALFRAYCCNITFRCNMWILLIVKLLSFKRYNYPFNKCRENGRQMQCVYSQCLNDKVVPLLFSLQLSNPQNKCKALIQGTLQLLCYRTLIFECKGKTLSWNMLQFIS